MRRRLAAWCLAVAGGAGLAPGLAAAGVRPAPGGTIRVGLPEAPRLPESGAAERAAELLVARACAAPLLEVDAGGRLVPGALAEVPAPEAGGRAYRLRLRADLRAASGRPLGAADVAAHLTSLLRSRPAPHAWVALPILGAGAVIEGRAALLAGVQVLSPSELLVTLAQPLPAFPWLLAATPAALPEAGPFVPLPRRSAADPLLLAANPHHHAGRAFARELELRVVDPRSAGRLLERGELDLVLGPSAAGSRPGPALPALAATLAAVNGERLGPAAAAVERALRDVDRGELARRFVRGPAAALPALVPGLPQGPAAEPALPGGAAPPQRLVLLADPDVPDQRAVAERLQVKLFDAGVRAAVELAVGERFRTRLAAHDYDVALVSVQVATPEPALAAVQVAYATRGPAGARRALDVLSALAPGEGLVEAAERLARELRLVPLVVSGVRASLGPRLQGLVPRPDGALELADLWLLGGGAP